VFTLNTTHVPDILSLNEVAQIRLARFPWMTAIYPEKTEYPLISAGHFLPLRRFFRLAPAKSIEKPFRPYPCGEYSIDYWYVTGRRTMGGPEYLCFISIVLVND